MTNINDCDIIYSESCSRCVFVVVKTLGIWLKLQASTTVAEDTNGATEASPPKLRQHSVLPFHLQLSLRAIAPVSSSLLALVRLHSQSPP